MVAAIAAAAVAATALLLRRNEREKAFQGTLLLSAALFTEVSQGKSIKNYMISDLYFVGLQVLCSYSIKPCNDHFRHRWTGRYEAHLWDKNCWNESQSKKGRQGRSTIATYYFSE